MRIAVGWHSRGDGRLDSPPLDGEGFGVGWDTTSVASCVFTPPPTPAAQGPRAGWGAARSMGGREHGQDQPAHRGGAWRRRPAGGGGRGAAGRRLHRAVHRPLPQGEDGRPRRHAAAQAGGAAGLPARAGGPPRDRAQEHRGAGQADAGAGAVDQRRGDQGRAGGPLRALQAQAPHQGADRARGGPRAAGRRAARRIPRWCRRPRERSSSTPTRASPTPRPRSKAPATS